MGRLSDPHDPFSVVHRMPEGLRRGEPIANQPTRRTLLPLRGALAASYGAGPGEAAVANFVYQADARSPPEVGVLIVPRQAFEGDAAVLAMASIMAETSPLRLGRLQVGPFGFGHAQIELSFNSEHPARFVPQRTDQPGPAPRPVHSIVFSGEATAPADPQTGEERYGYNALAGLLPGVYGLSDTLRDATFARHEFRSRVRRFRLELDPEQRQRVFQAGLLRSFDANARAYNTLARSCMTRAMDTIDAALSHTYDRPAERLSARYVQLNPYHIDMGLAARGIAFREVDPWLREP